MPLSNFLENLMDSGMKNVYGICMDNNEDAKSLDSAIMDGIDDCTGAMHQAVVSHIFYIRKNGWDKYVEEMEKKSCQDYAAYGTDCIDAVK